jgi:tRNA1(Val) A37 N6-methylase TrmN6
VIGLTELGQLLRASGLNPRALAAWAGTDRVPLLPFEELAEREPMPAAVALSLFVAGREIAIDKARALPWSPMIDALLAHELVVETHALLKATVAILPVGQSLIVCDRHDAAPTTETVCWPDDSSYHLASAIPHHRVERWLDLGCGSGFAPLVRPEAAAAITGVELSSLACDMATTSFALSGIAHASIEHGDLAIEQAPAQLVTCNAPMPGGGIEMWKYTGRESGVEDFFARLWRVVPERVAPGGSAIVHAAMAAIPHERLPGERRIVVYTPPDEAPAFGVLAWRPDAPESLSISHRPLTRERPHVDAEDFRA